MSRIPTEIAPSVAPCPLSSARVRAELLRRVEQGLEIRPAGLARRDPLALLRDGYGPKHKLELFGTTFYLTNALQNPDIRFLVAYVVPPVRPGRAGAAYPRIFYKDLSLVWRSASHLIRSEGENWIGKGDVEIVCEGGREYVVSNEATTDLPLELQSAIESVSRSARRVPHDDWAPEQILRSAPDDRIEPYRDFSEPRRRARACPANLIHGGRPIARFARHDDPTSLRFASGYEPDLERGVLEVGTSGSRLYGGKLRRFRILSTNRRVQYLFFAGPHQVWLIPPQATTTELSSYGVRTIDVAVPDDLCIPGYEYHFLDTEQDPPEWVTQIPEGFAGPNSPIDPYRADASPWLDRLPLIEAFRRTLLR